MLIKISKWIQNISSKWVVIGTLAVMLLFTAFVLPNQAQRSLEDTGSSVSPDTSFFYSPSDLHQIAESYGPDGRQAYIATRWTFDLIFPVVYMGFLASGISWLFQKCCSKESRLSIVNLFPMVGGLFDYLENIAASLFMFQYPEITAGLPILTPIFSLIKWIIIMLSFLAYISLLVLYCLKWMKRRFAGD
jgi:hypothetical protein